jgi:hypothetical protein
MRAMLAMDTGGSLTNVSGAAKRLLWNSPAIVGFCAIAMALDIGIIVNQTLLRQGILSPEWVPIFPRLYLFQDYPASILYLPALLLGLVPIVQKTGAWVARSLGEHPVAVAGALLVVLAAGAQLVYGAHPLAMDEAAPYMQSKTFAAGELAGRFPPALVDWLVYPDFQSYFINVSHETGRVASSYWPGFAVLLTPFMLAGVPWLCNPVLGALSLYVIHRLTLALTASREAAGLAMLFSVASAAFVINAISFYSMTAHLLCNALFTLLLLNPTTARVFGAGVIGGLALTLHNPLPHVLFAAPWVLWLLARKDRARTIPLLFAGYLPLVALLGFGWYQQGLSIVHGPAQPAASAAGSTVEQALALVARVVAWPNAPLIEARLIGLAKLWLWAAPGLLLLAVVGFWRNRGNVGLRLLVTSAALTILGYLFIPADQGHGWGFRYFHSAWFVLPVLAAAVLRPNSAMQSSSGFDKARFVAGASIGGVLLMLPFYAAAVHSFIGDHLAQLPVARQGRPRVTIINPGVGYYAQDLVQNDPFLRDPVIRMVTHGRKNDEAMMTRYFPHLSLLSSDYRGSVWGYPAATAAPSASIGIGRDQQR